MKKKVLSAVLAATMVAGMMGNVVSVSAEEKYDLTLYSINTTDPDFDDWLANVEEATGLNINVIAAPTDSDTRQQKITTILSTGDSSVDIVEINDEMSAAFKNSGWLESLNDTVMTDDIIDQFAQGYVKDMITDKDGNIVSSVPTGYGCELQMNTDGNWIPGTDGFYYYKEPVAPDTSTAGSLLTCKSVYPANPEYTLSVEILATAIQSTPASAARNAWPGMPGSVN